MTDRADHAARGPSNQSGGVPSEATNSVISEVKPAPASPAVSERYAGAAGEQYVRDRQAQHRPIGYKLNCEYFAPYIAKGDRVLDFGTGVGGLLPELAALGAQVEGLEVNPAAADQASARGYKVYGSLDELGTAPSFDVVVSNHVLEHVRDVCGTLERIRSATKPGGLLVVKLPIDDVRNKHQRSWSKSDVDHHLQTWTPRLFANNLFESGWEPEKVEIVTSSWDPRLFPLAKVGLDRLAFWALAVVKARRQLFAVARAPGV